MGIGRMAAFQAESSWRADGGRKLSSWVYLQVEAAVRRALVDAGRFATEYDEFDLVEPDLVVQNEPDAEARFLVREALNYLEAHLPSADWMLLWLHHVEGCNCRELAARQGRTHQAMRKKMERVRNRAVTLCAKFA